VDAIVKALCLVRRLSFNDVEDLPAVERNVREYMNDVLVWCPIRFAMVFSKDCDSVVSHWISSFWGVVSAVI